MTLAITLLSHTNNGSTGTQTHTSGSFTPTANSVVYVAITQSASSHTTNASWTLTDSIGSTFTQEYLSPETPWNASANFDTIIGLYSTVIGASPAARTVTLDPYAATQLGLVSMAIFQVTGNTPSIRNPGTKQLVGNITSKAGGDTETHTSGTLAASTVSGNLVVAIFGGADQGPAATPSGWSVLSTQAAGPWTNINVFYKTDFTGTSVTCSDMGTDTGVAGAVLFEIEEAAEYETIVFESISNTSYAGRTNTTITAPSGITDGDQLIFVMLTGNSSGADANDPTPPAGVTQIGTATDVALGGFNVEMRVYRKTASGESGDYTFTHATSNSQGVAIRYSGVDTSTPLDVTATQNSGAGFTTTATGLTTATDGAMLVYIAHDWGDDAAGRLPPTGMTERLDVTITYIADEVRATAGATGNKSQTNDNLNVDSPWAAFLVALRPSAEGSWTTFPDGVSTATNATVTGLTNGVAYEFRVIAVNAVDESSPSNIAGPYTPIEEISSADIDPAGLTLTGQTPTISGTGSIAVTVDTAQLSLTGQTSTISVGTAAITTDTATLTILGQDIIVSVSGNGSAVVDTATLILQAIDVSGAVGAGDQLRAVDTATLTLVGETPTTTASPITVAVDIATMTLTGEQPTLFTSSAALAAVDAAILTLTGETPTYTVSGTGTASVDSATLTLTGINVDVTAGAGPQNRTLDVANITLTGETPALAGSGSITGSVDIAVLTLTSEALALSGSGSIAVDVDGATLTLTGATPALASSSATSLTVDSATIALAGETPTVASSSGTTIAVDSAQLTLTGIDAEGQAGAGAAAIHTATLTLTGEEVTVVTSPVTIAVDSAVLSLSAIDVVASPTGEALTQIDTASLLLTAVDVTSSSSGDALVTFDSASLTLTARDIIGSTGIGTQVRDIDPATLSLAGGDVIASGVGTVTAAIDFATITLSAVEPVASGSSAIAVAVHVATLTFTANDVGLVPDESLAIVDSATITLTAINVAYVIGGAVTLIDTALLTFAPNELVLSGSGTTSRSVDVATLLLLAMNLTMLANTEKMIIIGPRETRETNENRVTSARSDGRGTSAVTDHRITRLPV